MHCLRTRIWKWPKSPYLCNVFFIVLDLRLTKDWLSGIDSLFLCLVGWGDEAEGFKGALYEKQSFPVGFPQ